MSAKFGYAFRPGTIGVYTLIFESLAQVRPTELFMTHYVSKVANCAYKPKLIGILGNSFASALESR